MESVMTELWKPVPQNREYEVSNLGKVRRGGREIKQRIDRKGYRSVTLWSHGRVSTRQVSRLVAEAFIGQRPEGHVVAHISGNNADNSASNLRYCTPTENERDKRGHGTAPIGERHGSAKLTAMQVEEVRRRFVRSDRKNGAAVISRDYGVTRQCVCAIVSNKTWRAQ